jgi:hypothetical protein
MAKTLLEFNGKIIDVFKIGDIEKIDEWDDDLQKLVYRIYFNRNLSELQYLKTYVFTYFDEQYRNDRFEELLIRLEDIEHITIL